MAYITCAFVPFLALWPFVTQTIATSLVPDQVGPLNTYDIPERCEAGFPHCPTCYSTSTVRVDGTYEVDVTIAWATNYDVQSADLVDAHASISLPAADVENGEVLEVDAGHAVTTDHTFEVLVTTPDKAFSLQCSTVSQ